MLRISSFTVHLCSRLAVYRSDSPFVQTAARLVKTSLYLINDANKELQHMLEYPFTQILASDEVSEILQDDFPAVCMPPPPSCLITDIVHLLLEYCSYS